MTIVKAYHVDANPQSRNQLGAIRSYAAVHSRIAARSGLTQDSLISRVYYSPRADKYLPVYSKKIMQGATGGKALPGLDVIGCGTTFSVFRPTLRRSSAPCSIRRRLWQMLTLSCTGTSTNIFRAPLFMSWRRPGLTWLLE